MTTEKSIDKVEYEFPDELEEKEQKTKRVEEPEIEVVDDTPAEDKNRKALDREVTDPDDDELNTYSEQVKSRIKELTHARHDERRAKEATAREKQAAEDYARSLLEENNRLKQRVNTGETAFVSQSQQIAEIEVKNAAAALKQAHESGDTDAFVEAQQALNSAQLKLAQAKSIRPQPLQAETTTGNIPTQQPQKSTLDEKAEAWRGKNKWFGEDQEMTSFALGVHNKLVSEGYDTKSDEYYAYINRRMKTVFPDKFGDEKPKSEATETPTRKPATVVAPANRTSSARKIVLTQSQVAIAKRLGVPLETYARQVAALEQK